MNVFKAAIEGITSLGRGTSQSEIQCAEAAARGKVTADGDAVDGDGKRRRHRASPITRARAATGRGSTPPPEGMVASEDPAEGALPDGGPPQVVRGANGSARRGH